MYLKENIKQYLLGYDSTFIASDEAWNYANEMIEKIGFEDTVRILGTDIRDYDRILVAGQLIMLNLTEKVAFLTKEYIERLKDFLSSNVADFLIMNEKAIDELLVRFEWTNYRYDNISSKSMTDLYLMRNEENDILEKPSTMFMRICAQHYYNHPFDDFKDAFTFLCLGKICMPTPVMLNAGTERPQEASCFTAYIADNKNSIYTKIAECGMLSSGKGGIGLTVSEIRHSEIKRIGMSKGLVSTSKLYDNIVTFSRNGKSRNGALTLFVEPWHIDILEFIDSLDKSITHTDNTIYNSDICIWMPWIFWDRLMDNGNWTLFCPKYVKELVKRYGHSFSNEYIRLEADPNIPSRYKKVLPARDLLRKIAISWQKIGKPFIMNKDSVNYKSNHKHIGITPGSNLCLEITQHFDEHNMSVCNLSSISLSSFAKVSKCTDWNHILTNYNFSELSKTSRFAVRNLNRIIGVRYSPLKELYEYWGSTKQDPILKSNDKYMSLGIGVQGLSTAFQRLDLIFDSELAEKLDECIFACIYFNAIAESVQEAIKYGICEAFVGSPMSKGKFQFDLWKDEWNHRWNGKGCRSVPSDSVFNPMSPDTWGQEEILLESQFGEVFVIKPTWNSLREAVVLYGMRNSLLLALMPTMSSAKTMRNTESVELHPSNIYGIDTVYGSFPVLNYMMVKDFKELGLWNDSLVNHLVVNDGQITNIDEYLDGIPYDVDRIEHLKKKYLGMMDMRPTIIKSREFKRNKYICQSTSSNVCMRDAKLEKLEALFMIAGEYGLKTCQYYLYQRSQVRNATLAEVSAENRSPQEDRKILCDDGLCCSS